MENLVDGNKTLLYDPALNRTLKAFCRYGNPGKAEKQNLYENGTRQEFMELWQGIYPQLIDEPQNANGGESWGAAGRGSSGSDKAGNEAKSGGKEVNTKAGEHGEEASAHGNSSLGAEKAPSKTSWRRPKEVMEAALSEDELRYNSDEYNRFKIDNNNKSDTFGEAYALDRRRALFNLYAFTATDSS